MNYGYGKNGYRIYRQKFNGDNFWPDQELYQGGLNAAALDYAEKFDLPDGTVLLSQRVNDGEPQGTAIVIVERVQPKARSHRVKRANRVASG